MADRATLNLRARNVGINPATYPNDSNLEQRVIYQEKLATAAAGATGSQTVTTTGTPADGDTITIGNRTYTMKTALTVPAVPNEVLIGGSAANSLINLKKAIDNTGVAGTDYASGTTVNPDVAGSTLTASTLVVTAKNNNTSVATTKTGANWSWGAGTLAGGTPTVVAATVPDTSAVSGGAPV